MESGGRPHSGQQEHSAHLSQFFFFFLLLCSDVFVIVLKLETPHQLTAPVTLKARVSSVEKPAVNTVAVRPVP